MSRLLSPEESKKELDGGLELEELAEELEGRKDGQSEGFDLIYRKDGEESSNIQGSVYTLEDASDWYDGEELDEVSLEDMEINIQEVKMNAVSGETVLVDSEGNKTRYDILSSFEGTTTFTQEVGRNEYVFRYDSQQDEVRAAEIGGEREPSQWSNPDLEKKAKLMDHLYHETRERLWQNTSEDEIRNKNSKFEKLRPYYNAVTNKIETEDKAVIRENTHVGSARGGNIKKNFKKAVKRAPNDSLDNYKIENDGNEYPIIIEES